MPGQGYPTEILHGTMIFLMLPTIAIGLWGRWLPLGVGLTGISLFLFMSFSIFAVNY